ncbi:hypothetical protein IWW54_003787 [Coemansia sp. RSA 2705]|nr:hypothetical protein IWW54_003787 [Coemansia sp. RSA 2705]
MSTYLIHPASDAELKEAIALRIHVFVDIQKFPLDEEVDEYDQHALHFVIGTLRVVTVGEDAKIGRVVVAPEYQGRGLGKRLLDEVEVHLAASGEFTQCKRMKLGSQYDKRGFYEKCGYQAQGDIYDELGCPHIWMYKTIERK